MKNEIIKTGKWPLSSTQSRIWNLSAIGSEAVYGRQLLGISFSGSVQTARNALAGIPERHPLITSTFELRPGGVVYQTVPDDRRIPIEECYVASGCELHQAMLDAACMERNRRVDLERESAARFVLFVHGDEAMAILFSLHPIVGDCTALQRIASDFLRHIETGDDAGDIGGANVTPIDVTATGGPTTEWVDFWLHRLGRHEAIAALTSPTPSTSESDSVDWVETELPVPRISSTRVRVDLLTALAVVLRRYSGCGTQRIGLVTRDDRATITARIEDILVLAPQIDGAMTLRDVGWLFEQEIAVAAAHFMPFETMANAFSLRDDAFEATALARTILDVRPGFEWAGTSHEVIIEPPSRRDAELVVTVRPRPDARLIVSLGFNPQRLDRTHVGRFASDLEIVLGRLQHHLTEKVRDIPFVSPAELDRLSAPYPDEPQADDGTPIHEVISAQAGRRPHAFAVAQGNRSVTHGELDVAANRLAHRLMTMGIRPGKRVAVALDKSIEAIAAILAILKAGGAFTPIDPNHPEVRNRHILSAPDLSLVITRTQLLESLPRDVAAPKLDLDKTDLSSESAEPPQMRIAPDQLAYVIYTSGSTGVPKGVAVEHGPLAHHCKATLRIYEMSEDSCEYPVLPFTSDGGHERWMVPLMAGGGVVLTPDKLATPEEAFGLMRKYGVNNASLPTSYVRGLAEHAGQHRDIPQLRLYSFGGEALPRAVFDMINRNLRPKILINGYGPTETIMTPMVWKVPAGTESEAAIVPIGRGVGDRRVYVLDSDLVPVPVGVVGEIYIGGSALARGYHERPDLTQERFIADPFSRTGARLYKSGDLGRWREDGIVEFVGRVDHQIKVRGYRIEPGEIESVLRADPRVAEAVVLLYEEGPRTWLVAYVVPRGSEVPSTTELRRAAMVSLPDYMVPQSIIALDKLPMGPNSKLDRNALPPPRIQFAAVEPRCAKETAILGVWRGMLSIPDIGVTENFFDIGGDSLAAVRIVSQLQTSYPDWQVSVADIFNHPTVRDLASALNGAREDADANVVYLRRGGERPVLYCFPGLLVSTQEYMRLVDYLGPDQPATGFICYSLTATKMFGTRVEDITARYAEVVRRFAKGQPCAFLGWSWGGLLAYEAARQLGDDIDLRMIGMVDVCDMDEEFTVGVSPQLADSVREETHRRVQQWRVSAPMRDDWDKLFAVMDDEVYEQFLSHVVRHRVKLPTDGPDIGSEEHMLWVLVDNAIIFRNYQLQKSAFRIHAFAAEDSLTRSLNVIDWRRYSTNATAPEIVNGTNHLTIIGKRPFHQRFARRLDEAWVNSGEFAKERG